MTTSIPAARPAGPDDGMAVRLRVGPDDGARHLQVEEVTLPPGATVAPRTQPFEESFVVFSGEGLLTLGTARYALRAGDFGVIPFGTPHAWANPADGDLTAVRVRAPLPRHDGRTAVARPTSAVDVPSDGEPIADDDPHQRLVGHYDPSQLPPYGSLTMPGARSYAITNISQRFMVDGLSGATHHTLFWVQFAPAEGFSASEHWHPFEEIYYFTSGRAHGFVDGEPVECGAGDVVFAAAGVTHGFTTLGDEPVTWIEAQSPIPPTTDGTVFMRDWPPAG
jgi:quercetin dioxygenase-like cupin family protein